MLSFPVCVSTNSSILQVCRFSTTSLVKGAEFSSLDTQLHQNNFISGIIVVHGICTYK